jgi:hypothetical protein
MSNDTPIMREAPARPWEDRDAWLRSFLSVTIGWHLVTDDDHSWILEEPSRPFNGLGPSRYFLAGSNPEGPTQAVVDELRSRGVLVTIERNDADEFCD